MTTTDFDLLFEKIDTLKIGVVGDVMLDTYWWGRVDRISPEAPVPIVAVSKKELRIGGAGNVALNLESLGVNVSLISIVGDDEEAIQLKELLDKNNIASKYLVKSNKRTTTNKIRIISKNQHMMRLDAEMITDISLNEEQQILESFKNYIKTEKPNLVILEDYNKGVLTEKVIAEIIKICNENNITTTVDPKRKNFFAYKGVTIFKPNLKEIKEALNILDTEVTEQNLHLMHNALYDKLAHQISFITLSEKGVYYENSTHKEIIPTHIRSIADVSGAGDTVIAIASAVYAATNNEKLMAEMANIAGGLVCEEVGTVAINKNKLLEECKNLLAKK